MGTLVLRVSASCRKAVLRPEPQGSESWACPKEGRKARRWGRRPGAGGGVMPGRKVNREAPAACKDCFRWLAAATRDLLAQNL